MKKKTYVLLDDAYIEEEYSLWPERWSMQEIKMDEINDPDVFATEMMNSPNSGTSAKFNKKDFRYWRQSGGEYILYDDTDTIINKGSFKECKWGISCDLAWEERRKSDFSVSMPGFLTPYNDILVDTYLCKRGLRPTELFDFIFATAERMRVLTGTNGYIGFEKAKLEKVVKWLLEKEMKTRNEYLLLKDLIWDADKLQRIYTRLQPRYAHHSIYHLKDMTELEYQLVRIPAGTHDDLPDSLQGLTQLFNQPRDFLKNPKERTAEDEFEWWRKTAINKKFTASNKPFVFGRKNNTHVTIPAKESYR
jgi:hypothetical protein